MVNSVRLNANAQFHFDRSLTAAATLRPHPLSGVNDQFEFEVVGFPGFSYTVQASADLSSWASVSTNVSPFTFTDGGVGHLSQRFYRAIYSP